MSKKDKSLTENKKITTDSEEEFVDKDTETEIFEENEEAVAEISKETLDKFAEETEWLRRIVKQKAKVIEGQKKLKEMIENKPWKEQANED